VLKYAHSVRVIDTALAWKKKIVCHPHLPNNAVSEIRWSYRRRRDSGHVLSQTSEMLVLFNRFNVNFADKTLSLVHLDFAGNTLISLGTSFHSVVARDSISLLEGAQ